MKKILIISLLLSSFAYGQGKGGMPQGALLGGSNITVVQNTDGTDTVNVSGTVANSSNSRLLTSSTGVSTIVISGTNFYPHITTGTLTFNTTP